MSELGSESRLSIGTVCPSWLLVQLESSGWQCWTGLVGKKPLFNELPEALWLLLKEHFLVLLLRGVNSVEEGVEAKPKDSLVSQRN